MRYRGSYFPDSATQYIDDFGGLDLRNRIANNAFSEMLNMSPEGAPEIVTRAYRYLSKASFGEGEYVGAITTVTVDRSRLIPVAIASLESEKESLEDRQEVLEESDELTEDETAELTLISSRLTAISAELAAKRAQASAATSGRYTEEPAYVYGAANGGCSLVFGMDGDETIRGFFSVPITAAGPTHSLAVIGRRIIVAPEMILVNLDTGEVDSVEATAEATTFALTDEDLTEFTFRATGSTAAKIYPDALTNHPDADEKAALIENAQTSYIAIALTGKDRWRYDGGPVGTYKGCGIHRCYSSDKWATNAWVEENKYLKLFTSDASKFHEKDAVTISGTGTSLDGEYILWAVGEGYVVVNAEFTDPPFDYCPKLRWDETNNRYYLYEDWDGKATFGKRPGGADIKATIKRKAPPIVQQICESGNRIWWCGFGQASNELINWIGCSKTGDPYNFYDAGDSWIGTVGEAGDFTGAAEVEGKPVFFKENCVFEVSGALPSSFRVTRRDTRGMEKGSSGAVCVSGGAAYYSSSDGPRVYGGSYSQRLTGAFGNTDIDASALAADGRFIYIAAKNVTAQSDGAPDYAGQDDVGTGTAQTTTDAEESPSFWFFRVVGGALSSLYSRIMAIFRRELGGDNSALFVYDTEKGAIYRLEDDLFTCLSSVKSGGVVGYDATRRRIVSTVPLSETDKETSPVEWQLTTGDVYANMPDMKYISAARVRMRVAAGGYAELWLSCDRGQWERQAFCAKEGVFTYRVPIIPGRCDSFRLRLNGEGQARLVSIAYEITEGGQ